MTEAGSTRSSAASSRARPDTTTAGPAAVVDGPPLAFVLGIVGTLVSKERHHPEKFAEMEVRSLTGAGAEKAAAAH